MPNLNDYNFMGNLVANPELRYTPSGKSVCNFRAVTNKKVNGKDNATFVDFVCWEKTAENVGKYLQKGSSVYVNGELCNEQYIDKNGNKRNKVYILATNVQFLGSPKGGGERSQQRQSRNDGHTIDPADIPQRPANVPPPPRPPAPEQFNGNQGVEEDMPF